MSPKYQRVQKLNFKHFHCDLAQGVVETWVWLRWGIFSYFHALPPSPSFPSKLLVSETETTFLTQAQVSHQSAFHHRLLSFGFCILHFAPSAPPKQTHSFIPLMFIDLLSLYSVSGTTVGLGWGEALGVAGRPLGQDRSDLGGCGGDTVTLRGVGPLAVYCSLTLP